MGDRKEFSCGGQGSKQCRARKCRGTSLAALSELGGRRGGESPLIGDPGVGTVAAEAGGDRAVPWVKQTNGQG